jgi:ribosomal-protein-alanine N-acetyltransferase
MTQEKAHHVPDLETHRLRLRPLKMTDAPGIYKIHSDPQTLEYWGNDLMGDPSEAEKLLRANLGWVKAGNCLYWAIESKATETLIGTCTLFKIDDQNHRAEIGYILNRDYWRQGLMTETLAVVIDYAFKQFGLHRLEADIDPDNTGSLTLLKKFGFKQEGYFRERWMVHGKWHDSDMLGLLKSEYSTPEV